jgi:hypothetical protein
MVWSVVKVWLDERTRAKVQIISGNGKSIITKALGEAFYNSMPKESGGTCECASPCGETLPANADPCMYNHPMSRAYIEHLRARAQEAGLDTTVKPIDPSLLHDQPEESFEGVEPSTAENSHARRFSVGPQGPVEA